MKTIRKMSVLSIAALIASSFVATSSFADHGYHGGYHNGYHNGYHGGYHDGVGDGFSAALASVFLSLATSDNNPYDADTLIQAAAIYETDGITTPVFESFVGTMSEQMTAQIGAEQMSKVDSDTLYHMVAEQILKTAK
jgi:hypothetical protein